MKRLAIVGASGHGKVVADCAQASGWAEIVFFDDAKVANDKNCAWKIAGDTQTLIDNASHYSAVIVAIGDNLARSQKCRELQSCDLKFTTVIHPSAVVSQYATVAEGCVIMACSVINAGASIGAGSIINTGATVDHDCQLGLWVHISPGANLAGHVKIGEGTWIGIGASVLQGVEIGDFATVGGGAAVIKNVDAGVTVLGVPAELQAE